MQRDFKYIFFSRRDADPVSHKGISQKSLGSLALSSRYKWRSVFSLGLSRWASTMKLVSDDILTQGYTGTYI